MANYAIGDLQGCFNEFQALLRRVNFNPSQDHLYLVGDIVARGPDSLACIEFIYKHQNSISITLGNHDLHLIACFYLNKPTNPKDKLAPLLSSRHIQRYIHYLQTQPLAIWLAQHKCFISHAGLNPHWDIQQALNHAKFAQQCYQGKDATSFFENMYGAHPTVFSSKLNKFEKFRYIVNYFTRMRFLLPNDQLELSAKGAIKHSPELTPWFNHKNYSQLNHKIIFGHWASLQGVTGHEEIIALDTGCVWGAEMRLINLDNMEIISEKSHFLLK
ncbi:symmetrical bis(5'-nucleosyl)-tetraphosphatase [Pseudoalteromonas sp. MMG010]|uniref:symmetrical bis(5'-nucleosyl)-tetraphosphatase n=1 Tax=Pseudoalteromonas sp. MMG010 TaxID=2822685 RepID=UPI001B39D7FC|nr:symmetrical bis(5'-nucleosyl)-tetraphosphatase [Pseudoalteromonas sp. MMG010]MBQ4832890.1 symmetrical bis(5'-nucleosyl)-tetraphosphatase [Pseudoalteromonas sp. MMG010]